MIMDVPENKVLRIISAIVAIVLIVSMFYLFNTDRVYEEISHSVRHKDLIAFITGAKILRDGESGKLYDPVYQRSVEEEIVNEKIEGESYFGFISPPIVGYMFMPALYLNIDTFFRIYLNLSLAAILATMLIFFFLNDLKAGSFVIPLIFFISFSTYTVLYSGQITSFLLLAGALIYILLKKGRYLTAGLLASMFIVKAHFLIWPVYLYFIVKRNKVFLKGLVSGTTFLGILNFLLAPEAMKNYLKILAITVNDGISVSVGTRIENNINLFHFYSGLSSVINNNLVSFIIIFIASAIGIVISMCYISKIKDFDSAFALSILFMLVFNIHTLSYDYILLLMTVTLLLISIRNYKKEMHKLAILAFFAVSTWMIAMLLRGYLVFLYIMLGAYLTYIEYRERKHVGTTP